MTEEIPVRGERLLRLRDVKEMTGLGHSSIYKFMIDQEFPRPLQVGPGSVRWKQSEVDAWIANRSVNRRETCDLTPIARSHSEPIATDVSAKVEEEEEMSPVPTSVLMPPPRWMTDVELRRYFGITERALYRLKAMRDFPRKNDLLNRTDSKAVDRFFDRLSGLDPAAGRLETRPAKERF